MKICFYRCSKLAVWNPKQKQSQSKSKIQDIVVLQEEACSRCDSRTSVGPSGGDSVCKQVRNNLSQRGIRATIHPFLLFLFIFKWGYSHIAHKSRILKVKLTLLTKKNLEKVTKIFTLFFRVKNCPLSQN